MAVTQQLARIPAAQLADCRRSSAELDELCSFRSAPEADYLDLDWWPAVLVRSWEWAGVDARTLAVARRAFDGDDEVDSAYRDHPDTIWEHPVTSLDPDDVAEVAEALRTPALVAALAAVPSDPADLEAALGGIVRGWGDDIAGRAVAQHALLRDFYAEAAGRGLATVLWWD